LEPDGGWLNTPTTLPNPKYDSGLINIFWGAYKVYTGTVAMGYGTAATGATGFAGLPADALGALNVFTREAKITKGGRQVAESFQGDSEWEQTPYDFASVSIWADPRN
jgi:hypothetical protein